MWEKAITAAEKDANQSGLAMHLNNLGMLYRREGRLGEAESALKRAAAMAEERGYGPTLANSHMQLGLVAKARGDLPTAQKHLSLALEIDKDAENPVGIAKDLEQIGLLYQQQRSWTEAYRQLDRAIRLYAILGELDKVGQLYKLLETNQARGGVPESLEQYEGLLVPPDEFWESPACR